MPKWLNIVWVLLPKKYIARLVIDGLMYLASKTTTELDDEFLENVEEWLIKEGLLNAKDVETMQLKHQEARYSETTKKEKR